MTTENIWSHFLDIVREELGSRVVETWFKAIILLKWDPLHNTVYLQTPNDFVKDWLESKYTDLLKNHLGRLLHQQNIIIIFHNASQVTALHTVQKVTNNHQAITMKPATPTQMRSQGNKPIFQFNQLYQFQNFIVGPHNKVAFAAAKAIADNPGKLYNPLLIRGESGYGKTHLLHAIGNEMKRKYKQHRILYQSSDRFIADFVNAIKFNKVHQFESLYKNIDTFLMDDIERLSHKKQTQEAFFRIFNMLHQAKKQIIFSCDSLPSNIEGLTDRVRSRLKSGLIVDLMVPTQEEKIAIIKKKSENIALEIDDEIILYIASQPIANIRELEGLLIRVFAYASLNNQPLTLSLAQAALLQNRESQKQSHDFQKIATVVAKFFNYSIGDMKSQKRDKSIVFARQLSMYLMKVLGKQSLREIGKFFNKKDHSSVIYAIEKIKLLQKNDAEFINIMQQIEKNITKEL